MCLCVPALPALSGQPCLGCSVRLSRVGVLGAAALVPLSASPWGLGIIQGDVISQADVGAEGLPQPLAEERLLPCGRCFREQEGAMERERAGSRSFTLPAFTTRFTVFLKPIFKSLVLKNWLSVPCHQTSA